MRVMIDAFRGEYARYKRTGEGALNQLSDDELSLPPPGAGNSVAAIVWHISGNLASRFTDFLTSDGEKPWRDRESEFVRRAVTRAELTETWEKGWSILFGALDALCDEQLDDVVTIRSQPLTVREALVRSLSHASSHVGQIVFLAKSIRGERWRYLSIPPGQSAAYNERAAAAARTARPAGDQRPGAPSPAAGELAERLERCITGPMWHGPALAPVLEGVPAAAARGRLVAGAHSIAEIVRHMTVWADFARVRLRGGGGPDPTGPEDWPPEEPAGEEAWQEQREALAAAYRALAAEVRALSAAELRAAVAGHGYTVEDMVRGVVEHGTWHGGQIAVMRRALGITPR
jgi:uncharacterized damage-inducible protein DinB